MKGGGHNKISGELVGVVWMPLVYEFYQAISNFKAGKMPLSCLVRSSMNTQKMAWRSSPGQVLRLLIACFFLSED